MRKQYVPVLAVTLLALVSLSCERLLPAPTPTLEPYPTFDEVQGPLKFEPATLPAAQVGVPYEAEIIITQTKTPVGDISLSEGALPPGLELVMGEEENTGRISGIPQETGTFSFTVYVWCYGTQVSGQTGQITYDIVVGE